MGHPSEWVWSFKSRKACTERWYLYKLLGRVRSVDECGAALGKRLLMDCGGLQAHTWKMYLESASDAQGNRYLLHVPMETCSNCNCCVDFPKSKEHTDGLGSPKLFRLGDLFWPKSRVPLSTCCACVGGARYSSGFLKC